MKVFSVNLTANVEASVPGGNFFMLIKTSGPLNVELLSGGSVREKAEGVEAGFKATGVAGNAEIGGRYFDEAHIISTTTQTIRVGISDGNGGYDRALGEVTAEPKLTQSAANPVGLDALTANNFCFAGAVNRLAVAAEYPHVQLLNPVGSGRDVYIDTVYVSATNAGTVAIRRYDTALITAPAVGQSINKNIGGAAGSAELRSESAATILAAAPSLSELVVAASATLRIDVTAPIRLSPGEGVLVVIGVVNTSLYANIAWREYA